MRRAAALLLLCLLALPLHAAEVALTAEVGPNAWQALRLHGLTRGASLAVRVEANLPIRVLLVHESEVTRFPKPVRPTFAAAVQRSLAFRVKVPLAGTYYVILDNRKGVEAREVRVLIEALAPRRKPPAAPREAI